MELLLWRHADAEEGGDDAARRLTAKGRRQARSVAAWLDRRVAGSARLIVSPAVRTRQTAEALSRPAQTDAAVGVGASAEQILKAAGWPDASGTVIVVGHQPSLGAAAALALTGRSAGWRIRKGAVWWLRSEDGQAALLVAAITPDLV